MWRPMELLGFPEDSLDIMMEGKKIAQEIGDNKSLTLTYSKIGNYYIVMGDKLEAIEYSARGFEEAEKDEDIDLMIPIGLELMNSTWQYGDCIKAVDIASKVIHVIEDNKRESDFFGRPFNVYVELHGLCGFSLALLGKFKEGEAMCKKGLRFAKDIEHLPSIASSEFLLGALFNIKGDGKNTIKHGEAAIEYCTVAGVDLFLPLINLFLGCGYFYLDELETVGKYLQRALQIQKDMGLQMFMALIYDQLGYLDIELGNLKSAQIYAEKALNFARKTSERLFEGWASILLGRILGKKEPVQFEKAEECIIKGIKMLEEMQIKPFLSQGYFFLGDLYIDMGRKDDASQYLKKAEGMFQEMEMDYHLAKTQEVLKRI